MLEKLFRPSLGFDYQIRLSRRKSVAIHVKHTGVEVRAPLGTSELWIHQFVTTRARWIERKLSEQLDRRQQMCQIHHGGAIWFKGQPLSLSYRYGRRNSVEHVGDQLQIELSSRSPVDLLNSPNEAATKVLGHWLREQAKSYMVPRTRSVAMQLGVSDRLTDVRFRKTRSKWGHCSSKGIIQYNWQIMMAPEPVIEYLICHEVSHLVHMNHSASFWQQVRKVCPDYAGQEAWLRENEFKLQWV